MDWLFQDIKTKEKTINNLMFDKKEIEEELQSKINIIQSIQESSRSLIMYYQKEI